MKVHDVFHVSLLKSYHVDPNSSPPPPPDVVDGDMEYTVERVLAHRDTRYGRKSVREYLIRWQGYGPEHDTWEPHTNMANAVNSIEEYWTLTKAKSDASSAYLKRKRKRAS